MLLIHYLKKKRVLLILFVRRYYTNKEKVYDIQASYSEVISKEISICFDLLTSIDISKKIRDSDSGNEGDTFINNYVDKMFFDPFFNSIDDGTKLRGNGHSLKESRHRKIKQAKKNGESTRSCKGRVPDRSLELVIDEKSSFSYIYLQKLKVPLKIGQAFQSLDICLKFRLIML